MKQKPNIPAGWAERRDNYATVALIVSLISMISLFTCPYTDEQLKAGIVYVYAEAHITPLSAPLSFVIILAALLSFNDKGFRFIELVQILLASFFNVAAVVVAIQAFFRAGSVYD